MSAPNALFLVLVAGDALLARRLPGLRGALGFGLGALLMLAPQLSWWWIVEGKPLVAPIHEMHLKFLSWNALKVLFSWNHGLFTWSPAWGLGVGVLGFWALRKTESRESRGVAVGLLVCLALQVYANGTHRWWGGTGFGARRLVDSFPILLIAFVYGFPLLPRTTRRWLLALSLACVAWTVSLFLLYQTREIERSGPVFPAEVLAGIRHLGSGANPLVSRHLLPFLSYSAPQWGFVGVAAALGAALLYFALYGRPYRPVLASLVITALGLAAALWLAHARTDPSSLLAPREIAALGRIEKLEKQLREAPADAATLRQLVRLELALGLDEEAAIHAGRLFAQDPADPANRSVMLAALLTLERWSAAAELVEVQLSERPDDANLLQLREELRAASARFEDL
jgi:hypothetical protein